MNLFHLLILAVLTVVGISVGMAIGLLCCPHYAPVWALVFWMVSVLSLTDRLQEHYGLFPPPPPCYGCGSESRFHTMDRVSDGFLTLQCYNCGQKLVFRDRKYALFISGNGEVMRIMRLRFPKFIGRWVVSDTDP